MAEQEVMSQGNEENSPDQPDNEGNSSERGNRSDNRANDNKAAAPIGRERVEVSTGQVVVIDQFMLANVQFLERIANKSATGDSDSPASLQDLASMYGGCVLDLDNGTYEVYRDPEQTVIALSKSRKEGEAATAPVAEGSESDSEAPRPEFDFQQILDRRHNLAPLHHVFIDTRCLAIIDAGFFSDRESVTRYQGLRDGGRDKQARDMLRELGGAVRYGFNKYGDELGVFKIQGDGDEPAIIALWPDVNEQ